MSWCKSERRGWCTVVCPGGCAGRTNGYVGVALSASETETETQRLSPVTMISMSSQREINEGAEKFLCFVCQQRFSFLKKTKRKKKIQNKDDDQNPSREQR